ncbi:MAG: M50 family metallopeptidase, partial [Terracidiphilus sp.]
MLTLRKSLCWVFALTAIICFRIGFWPVLSSIFRQSAHISFNTLLVGALFAASAVVFAAAWWNTLRAKSSARGWGLAASALYVLVALLPTILAHRPIAGSFLVVLVLGVVGVVAFAPRPKAAGSAAKAHEHESLPGDWTFNFVNKIAEVCMFALTFPAYLWWMGWMKASGVHGLESTLSRTAVSLLIVFAIISVHELGHAAVGLACGMKLRTFLIGPFQWRIREGKWTFKFSPKGFLLAGGATGIVPASAHLARWRYISMLAAGSLINVVTGSLALVIALDAPSHSPVQACGLLALFGAWSLALAIGNLLPFRTNSCYSDGASILQLLSGGAWADFQIAMAEIGSSQITSMRPRDYDIVAIQRAAAGIRSGRQGLLLRLFALNYFLDRGKIREAEQALAEAERVYGESPAVIPPELLTIFV